VISSRHPPTPAAAAAVLRHPSLPHPPTSPIWPRCCQQGLAHTPKHVRGRACSWLGVKKTKRGGEYCHSCRGERLWEGCLWRAGNNGARMPRR
jgi:hypothetical protein